MHDRFHILIHVYFTDPRKPQMYVTPVTAISIGGGVVLCYGVSFYFLQGNNHC